MKDKIKVILRGGGLVETNSSSSHALSICSDKSTYAKPGDPEFDLDIKDGVLYIPIRGDDFGWSYEKSNSCLTKLHYVCGFFFNSYEPLYKHKRVVQLTKILKDFLGVSKVVYAWEEEVLNDPNHGPNDPCTGSPNIDHNSYSESREEIMESKDTIIDFIFNKNSWFFGGNDNSDAPAGYYKEMKFNCEEDGVDTATATIDFGGDIGEVDFRVDMKEFGGGPWGGKEPDLLRMLKYDVSDEFGVFDRVYYSWSDMKFHLLESYSGVGSSASSADTFAINKDHAWIYYLKPEFLDKLTEEEMKEMNKPENKRRGEVRRSIIDGVTSGEIGKEGIDYIRVPLKLISDDFGEIFVY